MENLSLFTTTPKQNRGMGDDFLRQPLGMLDKILVIAVPWCDGHLLLVPGCELANEMRAKDSRPGRIWCVCEAYDLLLTGVSREDAQAIVEAKLATGGVVTSMRRDP